MSEIVSENYFKRASAAEIMDLTDEIQSQYPNSKINIKAYGRILSEFPQWALSMAVQDLLLGRIDGFDTAFCPGAPKIAQIATQIVEKRAKEIGGLRRQKRNEALQRSLMAPSGKTQEQKDRVEKLRQQFHESAVKMSMDGPRTGNTKPRGWKI